MGSRKRKKPKEFVIGIDDSGGHAAIVKADGSPIHDHHRPLVGVGAVTIIDSLLPSFEAKWNQLREKMRLELGLASPPPIHLRLMWGAHRPDPGKNPYRQATMSQVGEWLREACSILRRFGAHRYRFGIQGDFFRREHFLADQVAYYSAAEFEMERAFLASRVVPRGLYKEYQRVTAYPLLRTLPISLWRLEDAVKAVGGTGYRIQADGFTGANDIAKKKVVQVTKDLARLDRLRGFEIVSDYADSALVQAADLVAWAYNRLSTNEVKGVMDEPFHRVFGDLLATGRSLDGRSLAAPARTPPNVNWETLCIPYAVARSVAHNNNPGFVDKVFVTVEEFHVRALACITSGSHGVSVLNDVGIAMAQELAASKMTGPRSETAAE